MIYYIADTHFGHSNIIKYENRPFSSAEEMDRVMVENWNACVGVEDEVWFLGDFALAPAGRIEELMQQLAGRKYLILGNHDKRHSVRFWERLGFERVYSEPVHQGFILSHEWADDLPPRSINIYGHSHWRRKPFQRQRYCVSVENIGYRPVTWEWLSAQVEKAIGG